jgi:hypothetical protein
MRYGLALCLALALAGCGDGFNALIDAVGANNDNNTSAIVSRLAGAWTVTTLAGVAAGALDVPGTTQFVWNLGSNGTFTVRSSEPLSYLDNSSVQYDDQGTWRVVNGATATLGFTLTQRASAAVPSGQQTEVLGTYSLPDRRQLVLFTSALGPGLVRYVLQR